MNINKSMIFMYTNKNELDDTIGGKNPFTITTQKDKIPRKKFT